MLLSPVAVGTVSEILDASDFYRESHAKIYRAALALWAKGEPVDAITLADELDERGGARGRRRAGAGRRARGARSRRRRTSSTTRASSRRWRRCAGSSARVRRSCGSARSGAGEVTDLVDRAEQIVFELGQQRSTSDFAHIEVLLKESFERITQLYEAGAEITGRAGGVQGARPPHLRLPAGQPRHPRRPPVDGEVGARPLHRGEPRGAPPDARRALHARDVEVRGDATDDVQRGEGRVPAAPDGHASRPTTGRG